MGLLPGFSSRAGRFPGAWLLLALAADFAVLLAGGHGWDAAWAQRIAELQRGGYAAPAAAAAPLWVHWLWLCGRLPAALPVSALLLAPVLLSQVLLLLLVQRLQGAPADAQTGRAPWLMALAALHPALLVDGPLQGQAGLVYALPLAGALYLLIAGRGLLWVLPLLMLALLQQPAAWCLLPVLLPLLWRRNAPLLWAGLLPMLLLAELALLPYWLAGGAMAMLSAVYGDGVAFAAGAGGGAHNLWQLLGLAQAGETLPILSPARLPGGLGWLLTPRNIGAALLALWSLCLLLSSWRARDAAQHWRNAMLAVLGYVLWLPGRHAGELLPAAVLALLGAARHPRLAPQALLLALLAALDALLQPAGWGAGLPSRLLSAALLAYGLAGLLWLLPARLPRRAAFAAAGCAALVLLLALLALRAAPPPLPTAPSAAGVDATRVPGRSNSQGWGSLHIDQSVEGRPLRSGGRAWSGGFGTHAPSIIQLPVPSGAQRFTASAGLDDETAGGRLSFQVYADRQQLWDSGPINSGEAPRALDLDIAGRATLQLVVDPLGDNSYDHADWLEPRFVMGR